MESASKTSKLLSKGGSDSNDNKVTDSLTLREASPDYCTQDELHRLYSVYDEQVERRGRPDWPVVLRHFPTRTQEACRGQIKLRAEPNLEESRQLLLYLEIRFARANRTWLVSQARASSRESRPTVTCCSDCTCATGSSTPP